MQGPKEHKDLSNPMEGMVPRIVLSNPMQAMVPRKALSNPTQAVAEEVVVEVQVLPFQERQMK